MLPLVPPGCPEQAHEAYYRGQYGAALWGYLVGADAGSEMAQSNAAWMLSRGYGPSGKRHVQGHAHTCAHTHEALTTREMLNKPTPWTCLSHCVRLPVLHQESMQLMAMLQARTYSEYLHVMSEHRLRFSGCVHPADKCMFWHTPRRQSTLCCMCCCRPSSCHVHRHGVIWQECHL